MASALGEQADWEAAANPVLAGFSPDPSVCRVDHGTPESPDIWFYLVTSTFEYLPGIPVYRSRDLVAWELVGHVITDQLDYGNVPDSGGLFAPTIRHDGTRFLVVCTLVARDTLGGGPRRRDGNFIVTAPHAAGPWSQPVWWSSSEGIDPSVLVEADGSLWAHGCRSIAAPQWPNQGEIWVREIDPSSLALIGPETVVWTGAVIGGRWTEAPHLYRIGEWVYLVTAEGGTGRHHAVMIARAPGPLGPFEACEDNPIFTHRHLGPDAVVANVGHAELVEGPDGGWRAFVLASRMVDGVDLLGRETFVTEVGWERGWPVLAPGVGVLEPNPAVLGSPPPPAPAAPWIGVRRTPQAIATPAGGSVPPGGCWVWDEHERLVLTAGAGLDGDEPALLARRLSCHRCRVELTLPSAVLEALTGGSVDRVGLALRQSGTDWLSCALRRGGTDRPFSLAVTHCVRGDRRELGRVAVDGAGSIVLEVASNRAAISWRAPTGQVPVAQANLADLASVRAGGFVGVTVGPFAVGEGSVELGPLHYRNQEPGWLRP